MKTLFNLVIKYIKYNKKKSLYILFSIILSTTLLFSLSFIYSIIRQKNIDEYVFNKNDYHYILNNVSYDDYLKIKDYKNIDSISGYNIISSIDYYYRDYPNFYKSINNYTGKFTFNIYGYYSNFDDYFTLLGGRFPLNDKEIIIHNFMYIHNNLNLNDTLFGYKIVGVFDNVFDLNSYVMDNGFDIYDTPFGITKLTDNNKEIGSYIIKFKNINNVYNDIDYINNSISNSDKNRINVGFIYSNDIFEDSKMKSSDRKTFIFMAFTLSVFCIVSIYNSINISFMEKKKYFGMLKSIGCSNKKLFLINIIEILLYSIIGLFIGFVLSVIISLLIIFIINLLQSNLNLINYRFSIYIPYFIFSTLFIFGIILVSFIKPIFSIKKINIIESIKGINKRIVYSCKREYKFIRKLFGRIGELAFINSKRNSGKYFKVIVCFVASIVIFNCIYLLLDYYEIESHNMGSSGSYYEDIVVSIEDVKYKDNIINDIYKLENIDKLEHYKFASLYINNDNNILIKDNENIELGINYYPILLFGYSDKNYKELENKYNCQGKVIVYNNKLDNNFFNDINKFDLYFSNNNTYDKFMSVNNICFVKDRTYFWDNFPAVILPLDKFSELKFNKNNSFSNDERINLYTKDYINVDKKIRDIFTNNEYYNYYEIDNRSLEEYEESVSIKVFNLIFYSIFIIICLVCFVCIINSINSLFILRINEFNTLRSIGVDNKNINKMIFYENLFISIKSIIYSLIFSFVFVMFLLKLIDNELGVKFPYFSFILSIFIILIIGFIMSIYNIYKLKNVNILDSIRSKEI